MHTVDTLKADLAAMGLDPEGTVHIHSSMKAIGEVEGRADAVLDALMDYFAPGLLSFPALNWKLSAQEAPVYDVKETETIVGILPELFRKRPGVIRSWHPTHSVAAFGRDSKAYTADDHKNHTPCGPTSSWHKLLERDAAILQVGCTLTTCTYLHGVEEWLDIPDRLSKPMRYTVRAPDGSTFTLDASPHKGNVSEQFWKIGEDLRQGGALRDGRLGDAPVMVLSARRTYEIARDRLAREPRLFADPG